MQFHPTTNWIEPIGKLGSPDTPVTCLASCGIHMRLHGKSVFAPSKSFASGKGLSCVSKPSRPSLRLLVRAVGPRSTQHQRCHVTRASSATRCAMGDLGGATAAVCARLWESSNEVWSGFATLCGGHGQSLGRCQGENVAACDRFT